MIWRTAAALFPPPGRCRCFEVYTTQRQLVMVLEHLQGGELLDHLRSLHCYSEAKAAQIFRQVGRAERRWWWGWPAAGRCVGWDACMRAVLM